MDSLFRLLQQVFGAAMKEITTPAGRVNFAFGLLFLLLLLVGYATSWIDYAYAALVMMVRHTMVEVPGMPWYAPVTFLAYAVFCVVYVGQRT
jgi:hypothetical protein